MSKRSVGRVNFQTGKNRENNWTKKNSENLAFLEILWIVAQPGFVPLDGAEEVIERKGRRINVAQL